MIRFEKILLLVLFICSGQKKKELDAEVLLDVNSVHVFWK